MPLQRLGYCCKNWPNPSSLFLLISSGNNKAPYQSTTQQFQMNRYISQGFLKWLFWYILNLYGKLPLLVKKFLQKEEFKGPKKEKKNVDFATFLKSRHFLQMNR